jgi:hypothetical protein
MIVLMSLAIFALEAAVFVALVIIGVRLAIGAPIFPRRDAWARRTRSYFHQLRSTLARARHYYGGGS